MKKLIQILIALILLSACGQVPASSTPTYTPTSSVTPTPSATPTITLTPTPTSTPTPNHPDFYPGLAPSLEQFPLVDKSDISKIIAYLRTQPSLLSPDAPAVDPITRMISPDGGSTFSVDFSPGSCVLAASFQLQEPGFGSSYIVVHEVKMANGDSGYLLGDIHDQESPGTGGYDMVAGGSASEIPGVLPYLRFGVGIQRHLQDKYPYMTYLAKQPGLQDAVDAFIKTGIIPPELELMVMSEAH